jgi:preprotein translocase subunit SecY
LQGCVLLVVWIDTAIRKRGEGSGIFIALALVAGVPAAIIYSLVRIADKLPPTNKSAG